MEKILSSVAEKPTRADRIKAFGKELRERREAKGLDQKVLAARVGISPQHLSQMETAYERGERGPIGPSDDVIDSISEVLEWKKLDIRVLLGQIDAQDIEYVAPEGLRLVMEAWSEGEADDQGTLENIARMIRKKQQEGVIGKRAE